MKKFIGATVCIFVVLIIAGLLWIKTGSFTLSGTVEREFSIRLPFQMVMIQLATSDPADEITRRLGGVVKESKVVSSSQLDAAALVSGGVLLETVEHSTIEMNDENLGRFEMDLESTTKVQPGLITIVSKLRSPTDTIQTFHQEVLIRKMVGKNPLEEETQFHVTYSTSIQVNFRDIPFIRRVAEDRLKNSQEKTLTIICDTLKEISEAGMILPPSVAEASKADDSAKEDSSVSGEMSDDEWDLGSEASASGEDSEESGFSFDEVGEMGEMDENDENAGATFDEWGEAAEPSDDTSTLFDEESEEDSRGEKTEALPPLEESDEGAPVESLFDAME
ncbi:MAG: hypothetical protein Q4D38_02490 [Planctomycetia bacterium]|nr:hypothetical protein [Planctomycetia bacterium]